MTITIDHTYIPSKNALEKVVKPELVELGVRLGLGTESELEALTRRKLRSMMLDFKAQNAEI